MIFVATKIVSDHIATVAMSTTVSEIRWDRLMPQLQVGPDARASAGPATLACSSIVVKVGARRRAHGPWCADDTSFGRTSKQKARFGSSQWVFERLRIKSVGLRETQTANPCCLLPLGANCARLVHTRVRTS